MERVAIIGFSLSQGTAAELESLQSSGDLAFQRDLADVLGASELVYLATCNRLEIIYACEEGEPPGLSDLEKIRETLGAREDLPLRFCGGRDAVQHLFRVACSLDSLVLGEDQILFQMRGAHTRARENGLLGSHLTEVFRAAFQVGKQVRAKTALSEQPVSVMSLGVHALEEALANRGWAADATPVIALLGAGQAAEHVTQTLSTSSLSVSICANRNLARARELAARIGARASNLDALISGSVSIDALICATGAGEILLSACTLEGLGLNAPGGRGLVSLDLSLPRNLATDGLSENVQVLGMEALHRRAQVNRDLRSQAAHQAEALIDDRLVHLESKATDENSSARIESFVSSSREILEGELERLVGSEMAGLGEDERRKIERWARSAFGRLHHVSTVACRELGRPRESDASEREGDNQ